MIVGARPRHGPDPALLPRIMLWGATAATAATTRTDPDLWGHVRFGLDMLAAGRVSLADTYAFTDDVRWVNHEWLAEVLMAMAYAGGGAAGLVVLKLLLVAAAWAAMVVELRDRGLAGVRRDAWLLGGVVGCLLTTLTMRPHVFSLALFAWLLRWLRQASDGHRTCLLWLPPLMAVWANLHGGWIVGAGVMAIWTVVQASRADADPVGRWVWLSASAASGLATLLTPEGPALWQFLATTVRVSRPDIPEWQGVWALPLADTVLWWALAPVALAGLWRLRGTAAAPRLTVAVLLVASGAVLRLVTFATVATVMLLAPALGHLVQERAGVERRPMPTAPAVWLVVVALVVGSGAMVLRAVQHPAACLTSGASWGPDAGMARRLAASGLSGRLLTWFDWGEYAIWHLGPRLQVSMDGRRETVYSPRVRAWHDRLYWARDGWQEALAELDADYIWLPTRLPVVAYLRTSRWAVLAESDMSIVLGRLPGTLPQAAAPGTACFPD